jgi:hypothetical protein
MLEYSYPKYYGRKSMNRLFFAALRQGEMPRIRVFLAVEILFKAFVGLFVTGYVTQVRIDLARYVKVIRARCTEVRTCRN